MGVLGWRALVPAMPYLSSSLVLGVPGRVVRSLKEQEIDRVLHNAKTYVEYDRRYREGELG